MSAKHTHDELVNSAKNSNSVDDINYALGWCRRILRLIGVWSLIEKRTSRLEKLLSFLLRAAILCIQLFFIVPITIYIFDVEQDTNMKIKIAGMPINSALSAVKFVYLGLKGTAFRSCIEHIENDWRRVRDSQHRDIMLKQISFSRNLLALCFIFVYSASLSYYTIIPMLAKRQQKGNYTGRKLMHPGYDRYFDVHSSPTFELIYLSNCLTAFFRYTVITAEISLTVIIVTHICAQMQIQILRLQELCDRKDKDSVREQLSVIVYDHSEVLRFSRLAREASTGILLIEIFTSVFLLCHVMYAWLMEWNDSNPAAMTTYSMYLTSFTFNAFIFCYIGEVLTEQCAQIGYASYEVDWYNISGRKGRDFALLNVMSLYPPKLSGGKIVDLSLNMFTIIVKTSVVYLNLLRTVTTFYAIPLLSTQTVKSGIEDMPVVAEVDQLNYPREVEMSENCIRDELVNSAKNSNYVHDINHALGWCRRMLRLIGVWSLIQKRTTRLEKVVSFLWRIVILCIQLFFIVPITLYICYAEQDTNMKIKIAGQPINSALSVVKFVYLGLKGTAFRSCIEHMENDWRRVRDPQHRDIMLKQISISRNLIALCIIFVYTAGISYYTVIPLLVKRQQKGNYTGRRLMHPGFDRFFDVHSSPTFELLYSVHCLSAFYRYSVTTAEICLTVTFVTHICGQMQIQMLRLRELCKRKEEYSAREQLSVIVHDHAEVLRLSRLAKDAFTGILLIEIFNCVFLLCHIEYSSLMVWNDRNPVIITTYSIFITSFTFNAFIFCYIGEILTEQCSEIGFASYEVDWYNIPGRRGRDFALLNVMSLYPPKLSGGKIIELSLNMFSIILKTSVVYLNMLRTVTNF
ncbi:uncharacterized protein LOC143174610 [Nomia melanderi]|uniref:uncharacterized protein LOC143174610 n=1 Tax=Nomia melanderi TaxID=2448451 RepID=UPI003FCC91E4